ncbi:MAG: HEPN domain-containing protein [Anaerolineales bacterium]
MNEGENWLRFAREDLQVAKLVMKEKIYNQVCFHCQQCAEKSLKAWLAAQGAHIPKTHRMADLIPLVPATVLGNLKTKLILFDQFYIPTRYPDALPGSLPMGLPGKDDAIETLELAVEILKLIETILAKKSP